MFPTSKIGFVHGKFGKKLSEYLDDLLVQNGELPERKEKISGGNNRGFGMVVKIKEDPCVKVKVEIYPNETEEPHFKVTYQNVICRFKIIDCEPMKAEAKNGIPSQIQKIMKQIKKMWSDNKEELIKRWVESRSTSQHHGHQKIK